MFKRIAILIATAVASVGLATTAHAATSTPVETGQHLLVWHKVGRGYYWIDRDHSAHELPGWHQSLSACRDGRCRTNVRDAYHHLHAEWKAFNHELWTDALSLPSCQTSPDANCVKSPQPGFTGVQLGGVTYFAQTDAVVG